MNTQQRKALYVAAAAIAAVLVAYDVITGEMAPLWLNLAAALLGIAAPVTAVRHITPLPDAVTSQPELEIEGE